MKTKTIPALITLIAGSITSIITFWLHYPLKTMLWILLGVLLFFYAVGCGIRIILDKFEAEIAKEKAEAEAAAEQADLGEGNVVEKEMTPELEETAEEGNA